MKPSQAGPASGALAGGPHGLPSWACRLHSMPPTRRAGITAPTEKKYNTNKKAGAVPSPLPSLPSRKQTDLGEEPSAVAAAAGEAGAATAWPGPNPWPLYWRQEMNKS